MEGGNFRAVGEPRSEVLPNQLPAADRKPSRAPPATGPGSGRRRHRCPCNAGSSVLRRDCAKELARLQGHADAPDLHQNDLQ